MPKHHMKKVSFKKHRSTTLTKKVAHLEKMVKKDEPEVKSVDQALTTYQPIIGTNYNTLCQQITQGIAVNQRIGEWINCTSIEAKLSIAIGPTESAAGSQPVPANYVQAFLVQDKEMIAGNTTVSASRIWTNPTQLPNLFTSISNRGDLKILARSKLMNLSKAVTQVNSVVAADIQTPQEDDHLHIYHKFKYPLKVGYQSANAGDVHKNGVYLVVLSNYSSPNGNAPFISYGNIRTNYTDA